MTITMDGTDLFAVFAGAAVVIYMLRDIWEDWFK
jgi:hypothetical protein